MSKEKVEKEEVVAPAGDIIVRDPLVLVPKSLPLIVEPAGGVDESKPNLGWASKAQKVYADVLNAYAYKNPTKWMLKKDDRMENGKFIKGLLTVLKEKASEPDPIEGPIQYTNKLLK